MPLSREAPPFSSDTALEVERIVRSQPPTGEPNRPDVVVRHRWPPDLSSAGSSPLVVMQPWEFGGMPSAWIPQIQRNVSEVWCPTTWVKECYVRSGIPESKVAVVPLGVDTERFAPGRAGLPIGHDQVAHAALRRRDHSAQGHRRPRADVPRDLQRRRRRLPGGQGLRLRTRLCGLDHRRPVACRRRGSAFGRSRTDRGRAHR